MNEVIAVLAISQKKDMGWIKFSTITFPYQKILFSKWNGEGLPSKWNWINKNFFIGDK